MNKIDAHVGSKLRARRTLLGISQEQLGSVTGISFQQVQKYEKGLNRIGASRLYEFAKALSVEVAYFFDGFEDNNSQKPNSLGSNTQMGFSDNDSEFKYDTNIQINSKEIMTLVRAYTSIKDNKLRKKIFSLIITITKNALEEE
ncbi:MAG: helix-turn-helix transcriptional regulator [Sphingobacteriia bacterium]|nr:helix-turn-helix transcriptional regulator [Sphingobacteriia bacterium]